MSKELRQFFRKSVCGILCAAMVLTSLSVPEMTAYAAQDDVTDEAGITDETNDDVTTPEAEDEDTGEKDSDGTETPSGGGSDESEGNDVDPEDGDNESEDDEKDSEDENTEPSEGEENETDVPEKDENPEADEDEEPDEDAKEEDSAEIDKSVMESEVMASGDYGELQNGDFANGTSSWELSPSSDFQLQEIKTEYGNSLYIWKGSGSNTSISISQTVNNVEPGVYIVSLDAGGVYTKDAINLVVESVNDSGANAVELVKQSLGECSAWGSWNAIETDGFRAESSGDEAVNLKLTISGTLAKSSEEQMHLDNIKLELQSFTLDELKTLLTTANSLDEDNYTAESWSEFKEKRDAAQKLVSGGATDATNAVEITLAYLALHKAMDELASSAKRFYYYIGNDIEEGKEVGLALWKDAPIVVDADPASWSGGGMTTYKMTAVQSYPGWYSVPITVSEGGEDSACGFQIYVQDGDSVFTCSRAWNNNSEVYNKLCSGTESAYAVKNYVCFEGKELVTAILRNVTLYVYSTSDAPALMVEKASGITLSKVNEETAKLETLTPAATDTYGNFYYAMEKDTEMANWYYLAFTAPDVDVSAKMFALYNKVLGEWSKDFVNGSISGDWEVDFTPVFAGNIYYKDGEFLSSRSINLGALKALLEEAKAIQEKGQGGYTQASWNTLGTAISGADSVVSELNGKEDGYTDDDAGDGSTKIATAYATLESAIKGLEIEITFYYYVGTGATAAGMTFWSNDAEAPLTANASTSSSWHGYGGSDTTYLMTALGGIYPGWYSIKLLIKNNGGEDAGFAVHKWDGTKTSEIFNCSKLWDSQDIYAQVTSGSESAYAIKNRRCYAGQDLIDALMRNVTVYVYDNEGIPAIGSSGELFYVDERNIIKNNVEGGKKIGEVYYYDMLPDEENTNWYYLTFSAPKADDTSKKIAGLYRKSEEESQYTLIKTFVEGTGSGVENPVDFTPVFKGSVYYQDGVFYATRPATIDDLKKLVADATALKEDEEDETKKPKYKHEDDNGAWSTFLAKLTAAGELIGREDGEENNKPTNAEIATAYSELKNAMGALVPIPINSDSISVERVAVDEDFITGADLSSYVSLKESGVVFKDQDGKALSDSEFFKYLYDGGTNWVRVRIWNDPYNSTNGGGYGGGNSDLEKAKLIGKLATDAGMKVLIDFHYSDFWADPAKQDAPKEWENYTISQKEDAVFNYTLDSLDELRAAGVDVCMVQVGNETNNGICGENSWENMAKIFNAGSAAVREFDSECLVAIHFAEPQSSAFEGLAGNLDNYGVDYDVFASSYYPFWHGDTDNLQTKLKSIAASYGKKVMVAETSWVTTWEDGDGHGNSAPKTTQELKYAVSLQGQADEIHDVMEKIASIDNCIGMFYWEPAWISPYYVYNADGSIDQSLYKKNQELWEKYGSGWASSYSIEYDPTDAGLWYGGSAVDNQAWFDFDGKALETTQVYKYIKTAAEATNRRNAIANLMSNLTMEVNVGEQVVFPDKVDITFNNGKTYNSVAGDESDGNPITALTVEWDEEQKELVNTDKAGQYSVAGIVKCTYKLQDEAEDTTTETFNVTLTVDVMSVGNILQNPGFENSGSSYSPWTVKADHDTSQISVRDTSQGVRSGNYGLHFWGADSSSTGFNLDFTVEQKVENLEPGVYTFGGYIQGGGAADTDLQYAYVEVYGANDDKPKITYQKSCTLGGYLNWMNPEITGIKVSEGDHLVVGMHVTTSIEEAWGTIDDMYLYGSYGINIDDTIKNGKVTVNNLQADNNDIIRITATPDNGYYLSALTVSGTGVTGSSIGLQGDGGSLKEDADTNEAVLEFNKDAGTRSDTTMMASFKMPSTTVTISAEFASVFLDGKVDLNDVTITGFTLQGDKYVYNTTQEYTGKNIELDLDISYMGYKLTTADYTAKYSKNKAETTDEAMAEISLKAKGSKFEGSRTLYFKIADTKVDISKAKIELNKEFDDTTKKTYYYTGDYIEPGVSKLTDKDGNDLMNKAGNQALALTSDDYTVKYLNNTKVGKATIMVVAKENSTQIKGSITQTFTIAKRPISGTEITISKPSGGTYTGSKITPNVTVKYGNTVLQKGKDYKITYYNNTNVSTNVTDPKKLPYLKITGAGNFTGSTDTYNGTDDKITFTISEKSIKDFSVTATASDLIHNNKDLALKLTVKDGKKALSANKQYRVTKIVKVKTATEPARTIYEFDEETGKAKEGFDKTVAKVSEAGNYQVTLKGLGSYSDERTLTFRVVGPEYMLSNAKIEKIGNQVYTGSPIKLGSSDLKVTDKAGDPLTKDKDYTATYTNNIKAGTATVTITAKSGSAYAGSKSATFKITKRTILAKDTALKNGQKEEDVGRITFEFAEEEAVYKVGEEYIYPYTGYNWTPNLKIYSNHNGIKKPLTLGVDYTLSFKNNQKANDKLAAGKYASVIITGKGSYSGKVTIADVFKVKDVTLDDFVITINPVAYTGKAIKPAINFVYKETGTTLDLKAGTAYSVTYKNNTKAASVASKTKDTEGKDVNSGPSVTIKEKGLRAYKWDSAKESWISCPAKEKNSESVYFTITTGIITSACITDIKPQTYNGKPAKPAVTVNVNGRKLKAGTDYIVTYQSNVGRSDSATVTITGIGNYSGQAKKTFVIK